MFFLILVRCLIILLIKLNIDVYVYVDVGFYCNWIMVWYILNNLNIYWLGYYKKMF